MGRPLELGLVLGVLLRPRARGNKCVLSGKDGYDADSIGLCSIGDGSLKSGRLLMADKGGSNELLGSCPTTWTFSCPCIWTVSSVGWS